MGMIDGFVHGPLWLTSQPNDGEESEVSEVVFYRDEELKKRWRCSSMKLWRLRRDGKLYSIQIGGCGPYLTSGAEIARIEAPPENAKPAPLCQEGDGRIANEIKHPLDSESAAPAQASKMAAR
jgi:hypothetical protein